jgi:chromosomal replication initiator protein
LADQHPRGRPYFMPNENLWEKVVSQLKRDIGSQYFATWLTPIKFTTLEEDLLTLTVPSVFHKNWILDHYISPIQNTINESAGRPINIKFKIERTENQVENPLSKNHFVKKEEKEKYLSHEDRMISCKLDRKYKFENFVIGPSNQLAHAGSFSCADRPGMQYNPLFVYGGVGLGKTHLLSAIGHHILEKNKKFKICFLSAERFMNDMIACLRYDKMEAFRKKYRHDTDVLLMDDVHFLGGKDGTQEEFFHTFNFLHEAKRQIVISADKFPSEIPYLEERLRSRFEWGLIADIQPPEIETRIAILKKKAEHDKIDLDDEVAIFIAEHINSNIRQLEGALLRIESSASLTGEKITIQLASKALQHLIKDTKRALTIDAVQKTVATFFNITTADLKSAVKKKIVTYPRQIAIYLGRKHIGLSTPSLGESFGGRDHSTVIHAIRKIEKKLKDDRNLSHTIESIERHLHGL